RATSTGSSTTPTQSYPQAPCRGSSTTDSPSGTAYASLTLCPTTNFDTRTSLKRRSTSTTLLGSIPVATRTKNCLRVSRFSIENPAAMPSQVMSRASCVITYPDLRNTYSIIGICGIDKKVTPVCYRITETEASVCAEIFAMEIEACITTGFLRAGDVLVLNNAAIYSGKENRKLEDWLWEYHE
ncbi:LOW QUALITY PROTEIN: hypothetical protein ACHAWF_002336, partial [Thalassiosira exigua]